MHFFLTLNAPTATKVVCFSRLLKCLRSHIGPSLKLLAVTVFEISSFLCPNLQRAITKKKCFVFFNFHQVIYSLSSIS